MAASLSVSGAWAAPTFQPQDVTHEAMTVLFPFGPDVTSWGLERFRDDVLRSNARIQFTGDSWVIASSASRAPQSFSRLWPGSEGWAPIVAVASHPGTNDLVFSPDDTDNAFQRVDAVNQYRAFMPVYGNDNPRFFTMTCNYLTEYRGVAGFDLGPAGLIWHSILMNDRPRRNGRISNEGESWYARQLFVSPPSPGSDQFNGFSLGGSSFLVDQVEMNLISQVRPYRFDGQEPSTSKSGTACVPMQVNATFPDVAVANPGLNGPGCYAFAPGFAGTDRYLSRHSTLFYRSGETGPADATGLYLAAPVGDSSWSYEAMSIDEAGTDGVKRYSTEQLARYLDVSTVDPDRPAMVIVYFATELLTREQMVELLEAGIERWDRAFDLAELRRPRYLLMGNPAHRIPGISFVDSEFWVRQQNAACLQVAQTNPRCAFISLYNLSGRNLFGDDGDTRPGNQALWQAWLRDNGWDAWNDHPSGPVDLASKPRLWDIFNLHPVDSESSDFWWELALREFNEGQTPTWASMPASINKRRR